MNDFSLDLFGAPVAPSRDRRGRPLHVPTDKQRQTVRRLRSEGLLQSGIAKAIGISIPTLHRHYPTELESSSQARRRWLACKENDHGNS